MMFGPDVDWEEYTRQAAAEREQLESEIEAYHRAQSGEQNTSRLGDLGSSVIQGVQKIPGAIAGIADAVSPLTQITGRALVSDAAEWVGEKTGIQPGKWAEERRQAMSPGAQEDRAEIDKAWDEGGFWNIAGAYARNPWHIGNILAESAPYMVAGMGAGRLAGAAGNALKAGAAEGSLAARAGGALSKYRAGIGEGAIAGGLATDALLERDVDPRIAAVAGVGTMATTGILGYQGQRLAQSRGIRDVDLTLTGAAREGAEQVPQSLGRRVGTGMAIEGLAEELPQSVAEQMWQNWAEDKPLMEGTARAGTEGALAGAVMGGVMNIPGGPRPPQAPSPERPTDMTRPVDPNAGPEPDTSLDPEVEAQRAWKDRQDQLRRDAWEHVDRQKAEQQGALSAALTQEELDQIPDFTDPPAREPLDEAALARLDTVYNWATEHLQDAARADALFNVVVEENPDADIDAVLELFQGRVLEAKPLADERDTSAGFAEEPPEELPGALATAQMEPTEETPPNAPPVQPIQDPAQQPGQVAPPALDLAQGRMEVPPEPLEAPPDVEEQNARGLEAEVLPDAETLTNVQPTEVQGAVAPELAAPPVEPTVLDESTDEVAPPVVEAAIEPEAVVGTEPTLDEPPVADPVVAAEPTETTLGNPPMAQDASSPVLRRLIEQVGDDVGAQAETLEALPLAEKGQFLRDAYTLLYPEQDNEAEIQADLTDSASNPAYFKELYRGLKDQLRDALQRQAQPAETAQVENEVQAEPNIGVTPSETPAPLSTQPENETSVEAGRPIADAIKARRAQAGFAPLPPATSIVVESTGTRGRAQAVADLAALLGTDVQRVKGKYIVDGEALTAKDAIARLLEAANTAARVGEALDISHLNLASSVKVSWPSMFKVLDHHIAVAVRRVGAESLGGLTQDELQGVFNEVAPQVAGDWKPAQIAETLAKRIKAASGTAIDPQSLLQPAAPAAEVAGNALEIQAAPPTNISSEQTALAPVEPEASNISAEAPNVSVDPQLAVDDYLQTTDTPQAFRDLTRAFLGGTPLHKVANATRLHTRFQTDAAVAARIRPVLEGARAAATDPGVQAALDTALSRLSEQESYSGAVDPVSRVQSQVDGLKLGRASSKIVVVRNEGELPPDVAGKKGPASVGRRRQGVTHRTKDGAVVYLFADNIAEGAETAVLLHELGVHVGLARRLGKGGLKPLAQQITAWAAKNDGSRESELAKRALRRAPPGTHNTEEIVAYFVEEAVLSGINPVTGEGLTGTLKVWFNRLMALVRQMTAAVGLPVDRLTPQMIVDMAYAAGKEEGAVLAEQDEVLAPEPESESLDSRLPDPADVLRGAREFFGDTKVNAKKFLQEHSPGWLDLRQIADKFKIPEVQAVVDVLLQRKAWITQVEQADQEKLRRWAQLSEQQSEILSQIMREGTRVQYDPDPDATTNTPKKRPRLTNAKKATLDGWWRQLSEGAKQLYRDVRGALADDLNRLEKLVTEAANDPNATDAIKNLKTRLEKLAPYFPLMRLGQHYVVAMSAEFQALRAKADEGTLTAREETVMKALSVNERHFRVSSRQTAAEAAKLQKEWDETGFFSTTYADRSLYRPKRAAGNLLPEMGEITDALRTLLPEDQADTAAELVQQAILSQLPEQHYLTRHLKRKGVRGEETDMRRVFAAHAKARAHYLGQLTFAKPYNETMNALLALRDDPNSQYDRQLVTTAWNEFSKRTEFGLAAPYSPVTSAVVQWSGLAHLGFSPAYILTNLSQAPLITAPWISARIDTGAKGFGRTMQALWRGAQDVSKLIEITRSGIDVESELNLKAKKPDGQSVLDEAEQRVVQRAIEEGLMNTGLEVDLGLIASGKDSGFQRFIQSLSLPVRVVEKFNRGATALAAYRLGLAKWSDPGKASDFAMEALRHTQYDYTPEHAPRHMRSVLGSQDLARIVFQFRRYQIATLHLLFSNLKTAYVDRAATAEEKAIGQRTFWGIFGMTTVFGGLLMGAPFVGMMLALASAIGGGLDDDDEPKDFANDIRNWLHDIDPTLADVVAKGVPALLDMDLSQRIGMGNIAHPVPFARFGGTGKEDAQALLFSLAGAPVSNMATVWDGLTKIAGGDVTKGIEQVLPLKGAKDLMRAYRMGTDGQRTSTGEQRLTPEDFSGWDVMLRGMGIQPMKQSDYYDATGAIQKRKQAVTETRTKLVGEYARAVLEQKPSTDLRREITAFNKRHPEKGLRITQDALTRAVKERRKTRRATNEAGILVPKQDRPFERYGRFAE